MPRGSRPARRGRSSASIHGPAPGQDPVDTPETAAADGSWGGRREQAGHDGGKNGSRSAGESEKALRIFTNTVGEAAAYNNVGYLHMTQGRFEEAEQFLKKAMTSNPKYYERAQENLDRLAQLRRTAER